MRLIAAFFRLVRLPNLLFIVLTQVLFQYCIYHPLYAGNIPAGDMHRFILLVLASVLIAAAGYIINDYFDINIDEVNKPDKMVVGKTIRRRWAIGWHLLLSITGVLLTIAALPVLQKWYLVVANSFCVAMLWFYSTTFKRKLLIGNVIISLLTAWTVLVIFFSKVSVADALLPEHLSQPKFFRFTFLYAGFAFIISLIREAVKDIEDMPGDARYGCRTMPIAWGVNTTKVYIAVWLIILIVVLVVIQVYILQFRWWWAVVYCTLLIIAPLIHLFLQLFRASATKHYHALSNQCKLVMLTGILSMIFFYFYL
ncbi:MAG: geranylgeranylglycerol-phosphate geranylgeranyltransferase [Chitinophagaceae bacterium]